MNLLKSFFANISKWQLIACSNMNWPHSIGWGTDNSRNGAYNRDFSTCYGTLHLVVHRDRNGNFHQQTGQYAAVAMMRWKLRLSSCIKKALLFAKSAISSKKCTTTTIRHRWYRILPKLRMSR